MKILGEFKLGKLWTKVSVSDDESYIVVSWFLGDATMQHLFNTGNYYSDASSFFQEKVREVFFRTSRSMFQEN